MEASETRVMPMGPLMSVWELAHVAVNVVDVTAVTVTFSALFVVLSSTDSTLPSSIMVINPGVTVWIPTATATTLEVVGLRAEMPAKQFPLRSTV
jgi:hypothetical protein